MKKLLLFIILTLSVVGAYSQHVIIPWSPEIEKELGGHIDTELSKLGVPANHKVVLINGIMQNAKITYK